MLTAAQLIELLRLERLPVEGGHFRETWRSADEIPEDGLPPRYGRAKPAGSAIFYLLTDDPDSFSALHRLPTDEVYHFYLGDPVELVMLRLGGPVETVVLGPDLLKGQRVQQTVPHGVWQGSRLVRGGHVALLGTTMAPGFDPHDYEAGSRDALLHHYPQAAELITALTHDT